MLSLYFLVTSTYLQPLTPVYIDYPKLPQVVQEVVIDDNDTNSDSGAVLSVPEPIKYDVVACQCATYARLMGTGIPYGILDAKFIQTWPKKPPVVGGIVLLKYGNIYHVAVIIELLETGVKVKESNFKRCQYTTRVIDYSDSHIVQFWNNR